MKVAPAHILFGRSIFVPLILAFVAFGSAPSRGDDLRPLVVNTFPNAKALPLWVGIDQGFFQKYGLKVDLELTEGSKEQRDRLESGRVEIAQSALDNAVAMIVARKDVLIVMGADSGMNEFMVQSYVGKFEDMRGHVLVVDAPDTAYALQAKKILAQHGLKENADYSVKSVGNAELRLKALLAFSVEGAQKGLRSLGRTVDMLGPYQAGGAFVMRSWAKDNAPKLDGYIRGYVDALRWVTAAGHRAEVVDVLVKKLKLAREVAEQSYPQLADPSFGFSVDAKFDTQGFNNMLALRAEVAGQGELPPPDRYVDLSYYDRAMKPR
jgi:ABC-type nitrate/sulfonate/bicarbonate transport system substrate-binding protein